MEQLDDRIIIPIDSPNSILAEYIIEYLSLDSLLTGSGWNLPRKIHMYGIDKNKLRDELVIKFKAGNPVKENEQIQEDHYKVVVIFRIRKLSQTRSRLEIYRKDKSQGYHDHILGLIEELEKDNMIDGEIRGILKTDIQGERIEKRGQSRYSKKEKLDALLDWDKLDKSELSLGEFIQNRFGSAVPKSTFHSWRRQLRKSGDYKTS